MFKRYTIGFKIISSLAAILVLVVGANVAIFIMQQERITREVFAELTLMNNAGKIALTDSLEAIKHRAIDFSSDGFIRDATETIIRTHDQKTVDALGDHLRNNKMSLDSTIYGINILDERGTVIASTAPEEIGKSGAAQIPGWRAEDLTYGTALVSDFLTPSNFNTHTIALTVAAPLADKERGRRIGTLVNFIKASSITNKLQSNNEIFSGADERYGMLDLFVTNSAGYIIDGRYFDGTKLTQQADIANILKCNAQTEYRNISGLVVIGAALCMDNGWTIVSETPRSAAFGPVEEVRRSLIYLVAILVTLILLIVYLMNRTVIDPIRLLALSARRLGEGDFDARTHIGSADELGDLSLAFDGMAERLKDSHHILAQKIREITGDFEKFKLAVEGTSDHVVITDKDGVIIYANKAAELTTGYSRAEILGNRPSLWGKQMPAEFYRRMWHTIKEEKKDFHGEITNKRKNGQLYIAESHISPLFNEQGELYGFVGVERDITRQKEIDKSKTEFVSVASHQLRTPLTIINWYIEMLSDPKDATLSEKQRQYLDEIARASKRMIELVNALLNVSRIDLGTFMVDVEPLDFSAAMEDILKDLALEIARKRIKLVKQHDRAVPLINADPKLLRMIFQNLLTNAVKYTPDGGSITIGVEKKGENVLVNVTDTGFGIPAHQQDKIFTKFFRADNARVKEPDGNGLGLYIIKSLIEHSGGRIWFVSKENEGTSFFVELPLAGMKAKEGSKPLAT